MDAGEEEVEAIRGLGSVIADSVVAYFRDPSARALIRKLIARGLTMDEPQAPAAGGALRGQTIVITGTLPSLSRAEATALVESHGGRVTSSVSKATTFVLAGDDAGSKLDKARTLGVPVIDQDQLFQRIGRA